MGNVGEHGMGSKAAGCGSFAWEEVDSQWRQDLYYLVRQRVGRELAQQLHDLIFFPKYSMVRSSRLPTASWWLISAPSLFQLHEAPHLLLQTSVLGTQAWVWQAAM